MCQVIGQLDQFGQRQVGRGFGSLKPSISGQRFIFQSVINEKTPQRLRMPFRVLLFPIPMVVGSWAFR